MHLLILLLLLPTAAAASASAADGQFEQASTLGHLPRQLVTLVVLTLNPKALLYKE